MIIVNGGIDVPFIAEKFDSLSEGGKEGRE